MTTVSTVSQARRRKTATYGKASRNNNAWSTSGFSAPEEDDIVVPKLPTERLSSVKDTYTVQKHEPKCDNNDTKSNKRRPKPKQKQDTFDIPSSDDETEAYIERLLPPEHLFKRKPFSAASQQEREQSLAPWERKKDTGFHRKLEARLQNHTQASADAQLHCEIAAAAEQISNPPQLPSDKPSAASPVKAQSPAGTGAAARLQARKVLSASGMPFSSAAPSTQSLKINKRSDNSDNASETPRKRLRQAEPPQTQDPDLVMEDTTPLPTLGTETKTAQEEEKKLDIFDIPDSDEEAVAKKPKLVAGPPGKQKARRGKLTTYSRSSPRTMTSAPARLTEMLPSDRESVDTISSHSPSSSRSRLSTPKKATSSSKESTPETALKLTSRITPQEAPNIDQTLPSDAPSPSGLPMQDLNLHTKRTSKIDSVRMRSMPKSRSDVGPRRVRLVDRLRASAPSSDSETSDDTEVECSDSDAQMQDAESVDGSDECIKSNPVSESQQSQSLSQSATGAKITYARVRSHLPEDSFEADLMLNVPAASPEKPALSRRTTERSNAASQKSAFDVEDSDEEASTGRLRSLHELRAAGANQRFMDDTLSLLSDIADHAASSRSRRRSALIELASKLADKAFIEKFFRQSFERQLMAECSAAPDNVADFALAACFVVMMAHDIPDPAIQVLKVEGLLSWLSQRMDQRHDAKVVARDRQHNMSKSAQTIFMDFASEFASNEAIWGEGKPGPLTLHLLAMKASDQLVRRLRRSGDTSDIATSDETKAFTPAEDDIARINNSNVPLGVALSMSTLESLSTTALALNWPHDVLERIRTVLVAPGLGSGKTQHFQFLTLRLCLNLTNDNARNCKALSKDPTVPCLLGGVNQGFADLAATSSDEHRTLHLDLLVLTMGVLINLTEHGDNARAQAASPSVAPLLASMVDVFLRGQKVLLDAETVEQSVTNVAYGYLAVVLANLCRNVDAKNLIMAKLPGENLGGLVDALTEFVAHHQRVDMLNFEGEEGMDVWSAFTEKLKGVLVKLKAEAEAGMGL